MSEDMTQCEGCPVPPFTFNHALISDTVMNLPGVQAAFAGCPEGECFLIVPQESDLPILDDSDLLVNLDL